MTADHKQIGTKKMRKRSVASVLAELMEGRSTAGRRFTQNDLEKLSGIPQATISRILSGKHGHPGPRTIDALARCFGIRPAQMRGEEPIGLVLDNAKPYHSRATQFQIPYIPWQSVAAGEQERKMMMKADAVVITTSLAAQSAFATSVEGDAMLSDRGPSFPAGSIIIVDPDATPEPGKFVVVSRGGSPIFRRLEV